MITYRMRFKHRGFNFTEACVIDIRGWWVGGGYYFSIIHLVIERQ